MTDIASAAREYWERGWSLVPIRSKSKEAAVGWTPFQTKRAELECVQKWFRKGKHKSLAVICGEVSGNLVCRDFDNMEGYELWAAEYPDLARTLPTVATGRAGGGRHVYCRCEIDEIRGASRSGKAATINHGDGETRGSGYCVLPPSIHPSGQRYEWLISANCQIPFLQLKRSGFLQAWTIGRENSVDREGRDDGEDRDDTDNSGLQRRQKPLEVEEVDIDVSAEVIQMAIAENLPEAFGQRNRCLFQLARALKAIPKLETSPPAKLRPIVVAWHRAALRRIRTKPFEESWLDFVNAWKKVEFPKGSEPMAAIIKNARAAVDPAETANYEQDKLRLLIKACRELQREAGDGCFYLGCRKAGEIVGVTHTQAHRWLTLLEIDGLLQCVKKGTQSGRKASRFRYLGTL